MAEQSKNSSSNKGMKIVVIIGIIVIIALLAAILVLLLGKKEEKPQEKRAVVVTEEKAEEVAETMLQEEYVAPGYYETSMTTEWHFPSGDQPSTDAYVANVERNTNDVYFDIVLSEDESVKIYSSPVIPRGAELENISLDTVLDAGTYDCVLIYHLVDENQNSISELRVGLTIIVEN